MVITRMRLYHHVDIAPAEQAALIKYLADEQGLAPEEAAPYRYILERRPNYIEKPPSERLALVCGSCHSFARVGLNYRDRDEWLKHVNFHLAQWPSLEYQSRLRAIQWWKIASTQIPQDLAKRFPLETSAWTQWRKHEATDLSGNWRAAGHEPGAGDYRGLLTVKKSGNDRYDVRWALEFAGGNTLKGNGLAILYTGYEWRGSTTLGGKAIRQVFAVAPDGNSMTGRWFYSAADERGGDLNAVRISSGAGQVMAVQPSSLRAGAKTQIAIVGVNLKGDPRLGDGIKVLKVVTSRPDEKVVIAQADNGAADGPRDVSLGDATGKSMLVVYHKLDAVRVEPDYAMARVGGNGGPLAPVTAQFEAVGYLNDPDGKPAVRVGVVPATWSVRPFNDTAADLQDTKFAGQMDSKSGLFTPAGAGPNPKRRFGTNNFGDLSVLATVEDTGKPLRGTAHLIVGAQRWVDPPVR